MLTNIKLNLQEIEAMLYFWHACKDKEKVSEKYLSGIAAMPGVSLCYDKEFDGESLRKVLSSITNRERLSHLTKSEGRFWTNNMWMMEDLEFTDRMAKPLKVLNIDSLLDELKGLPGSDKYEELEVFFSPWHFDEYLIKGNKLVINFFKVKPDDSRDSIAYIDGIELKDYIKTRLEELLRQA
jgi:hypothetical protein